MYKKFYKLRMRISKKAFDSGEIKIVVLYNAAHIDKSKCPEILRNIGRHKGMTEYNLTLYSYKYDYSKVKDAIES